MVLLRKKHHEEEASAVKALDISELKP